MGGLARHPRIYDALAGRATRPLRRRVLGDLALVAPPADGLVVDLGCGPGRLVLDLAEAFPAVRVTGIDLSAAMVARARAEAVRRGADLSRVSCEVGDAAALPLPDRAAAAIVVTASVHHWAEIVAGLAEIGRVLAPTGTALLYEPRSTVDEAARAAAQLGLDHRVTALPLGFARLALRPRP